MCTRRGHTQRGRRLADIIDWITLVIVVVVVRRIGNGMSRCVGIGSRLVDRIEAERRRVLFGRWLTTTVFRRRCADRWNDVRKKIMRWTFTRVWTGHVVFVLDIRWGRRKMNDRFNMNSTGTIGETIGKGSGHLFIGNDGTARSSLRIERRRWLLLNDLEEENSLSTSWSLS